MDVTDHSSATRHEANPPQETDASAAVVVQQRANTAAMELTVPALTNTVVDLGRLALAFGRITRLASHPNGGPAESDTDHTVMLGWVACSLAVALYPNTA
ncbi:hypothetical protein [Parafrankia discariae]|uniref:hypothetical protein n=1 Tax=Parafrankia discariae TaxID=365528 RepID=UPI0003681B5E|nr:hypothetical protein [Parafrankia discariae]